MGNRFGRCALIKNTLKPTLKTLDIQCETQIIKLWPCRIPRARSSIGVCIYLNKYLEVEAIHSSKKLMTDVKTNYRQVPNSKFIIILYLPNLSVNEQKLIEDHFGTAWRKSRQVIQ